MPVVAPLHPLCPAKAGQQDWAVAETYCAHPILQLVGYLGAPSLSHPFLPVIVIFHTSLLCNPFFPIPTTSPALFKVEWAHPPSLPACQLVPPCLHPSSYSAARHCPSSAGPLQACLAFHSTTVPPLCQCKALQPSLRKRIASCISFSDLHRPTGSSFALLTLTWPVFPLSPLQACNRVGGICSC